MRVSYTDTQARSRECHECFLNCRMYACAESRDVITTSLACAPLLFSLHIIHTHTIYIIRACICAKAHGRPSCTRVGKAFARARARVHLMKFNGRLTAMYLCVYAQNRHRFYTLFIQHRAKSRSREIISRVCVVLPHVWSGIIHARRWWRYITVVLYRMRWSGVTRAFLPR